MLVAPLDAPPPAPRRRRLSRPPSSSTQKRGGEHGAECYPFVDHDPRCRRRDDGHVPGHDRVGLGGEEREQPTGQAAAECRPRFPTSARAIDRVGATSARSSDRGTPERTSMTRAAVLDCSRRPSASRSDGSSGSRTVTRERAELATPSSRVVASLTSSSLRLLRLPDGARSGLVVRRGARLHGALPRRSPRPRGSAPPA